MKITSAKDIGRIVREKRKKDGLTLEEAAAVCGVSYAFLSALENGKETARLDKILASGLESLTETERGVMARYSRRGKSS